MISWRDINAAKKDNPNVRLVEMRPMNRNGSKVVVPAAEYRISADKSSRSPTLSKIRKAGNVNVQSYISGAASGMRTLGMIHSSRKLCALAFKDLYMDHAIENKTFQYVHR